jgi:hypothetical protein
MKAEIEVYSLAESERGDFNARKIITDSQLHSL